MKVAVCILNYNGANFLKKYLPFLLQTTYQNASFHVIDNASTDDSLSIATQFESIKWHCLKENFGYAGGYNHGLKNIEADIYILLNSDVEVTPNWLEPIVDMFNSDDTIAAVQPKILQIDKRNYFEYAGASGGFIDKLGFAFCKGRIFDNCEVDNGQYNKPTAIMWASGACLAITKESFEKVGGLDERFFAHFEEIDLCWRLQRAGYKIFSQPLSIIHHVGGGTLPVGSYRKVYLNFRNNHYMLLKNAPVLKLLWLLPLRYGIEALVAYKELILKGNFTFFKAVFFAHLHAALFIFSNKRNKHLKRSNAKYGVYNGSIIYSYYFKKIKEFSALNIG